MWQLTIEQISIPFIAAVIGWITNVIAVKMTFYPIKYKGIRPFGWQGIIPAQTEKMAQKSVELLTRDLIVPQEIFSRINADLLLKNHEKTFKSITRKITSDALNAKIYPLWNILPQKQKEKFLSEAENLIEPTVKSILDKIKQNINEIINLKFLTIKSLKEDKSLINKIFLNLGAKQFRFIETSGLWLGFIFGIGQIITSIYCNYWYIYLIYGIFIGWITNFLAIKMIFEPTRVVKIGPFKIVGLFIKNQKSEAAEYAEIIENKILTPQNIFDSVFRTPETETIYLILNTAVDESLKKITDSMNGIERFFLSKKQTDEIKSAIVFNMLQELPLKISELYPDIKTMLNIKQTVFDRMSTLPGKKFIDFLRPAFKEDEWKLILAGAVLGGVAGIIQYAVTT